MVWSSRALSTLAIAPVLMAAAANAEHVAPLFPWSGEATMIAGTASYAEGEYIYTDYVFDDMGPFGGLAAALGLDGIPEPLPATVVGTSGSAEYPHDWDRYGDNAADLVEVRVTADAANVYYRILLSTLMAPDSTAIVIAVDEDAGDTTGGGALPFGVNLSIDGWDHAVTLWGTGGAFTAGGSTSDLAASGGAVRVDLDENVIEARVPRALADPGTGTWRIRAMSGLWNPAAGAWLPFAPVADETSPGIRWGGVLMVGHVPNVFNVAFRFDEDPDATDFGNQMQGTALAASDVSAFVAEVDFARIAARESDAPDAPPAGIYQRLYRSRHDSEGVVDLQMRPCYESVSADNQPRRHPTCAEHFLSRYQPYLVLVPEAYDHGTPSPLLMTSHGYSSYFHPVEGQVDLAERHGVVVVSTLGRGQGSVYLRAADADALEVLADAKRRYTIDENRVSAYGESHAGAFVYLVTSLYPDLFSAGAPLIPGYIKHERFGVENDVLLNFTYLPLGPEGDRLQGVKFHLKELFENLRNVPLRIFTGDEDPATPPGRYELTVTDRLEELGYDYLHTGCSVHTHGPQSAEVFDAYLEFLVTRVRNPNPREVVYKGNTGADAWNEPWGNRHDSAYWLRDITFADPNRFFLARAESFALAAAGKTPTPVTGQFVTGDTPPSVCHFKGIEGVAGSDLPVGNRLVLDLDNVASARIEAGRAALTLDEPLTLAVDADHDGVLRLAGLGAGTPVATLDGEPHPVASDGGDVIIIEIVPGGHEYVIED